MSWSPKPTPACFPYTLHLDPSKPATWAPSTDSSWNCQVIAVCTSWSFWLAFSSPELHMLPSSLHLDVYSNVPSQDFPGGAVVKNLPANAGDWVQALVREDPKCCGATKPVHHNYWACALEPARATATEARTPRARAPQQEKPPQWEARAPQRRVALLIATRESPCAATKTQHSQK